MWQKWQYYLRDTFGFTQTEIKGFWVLVSLLLLLGITPFLAYFITDDGDVSLNKAQADSLMALVEVRQKKFQRENDFEDKFSTDFTPFRSNEKVAARLFSFNPNEATEQQFQELGLPRWLGERIVKYRSKGGKFRKKEDLLRIYNFPKDLYYRLEPYMVLEQVAVNQSNVAENASPIGETKSQTESKPFAPKTPSKFDLNTADTSQLIKLKGIGLKLATRIVKFRDNLGGFYAEEQIREVFGLDSTVVDEILKFAYVKNPALKKIKINVATSEEMKHPYLKPFVAKAIVAYRQQHGDYASVKDLANVKVLEAKVLEKILPYLEF